MATQVPCTIHQHNCTGRCQLHLYSNNVIGILQLSFSWSRAFGMLYRWTTATPVQVFYIRTAVDFLFLSRCCSCILLGLCSLTCVGWVGSGSVEEAGWTRNTKVGHASGSVAIHGGGDGVVVGLLRRGARHIATRRHTVGVTWITYSVGHRQQA